MRRVAIVLLLALFGNHAVAHDATTTTTTLPETTTTFKLIGPSRALLRVSGRVVAMAYRVAVCEEGGWNNAHGPNYYGALGWRPATWTRFRRADFPGRADMATILQQSWAMARFASVYGWPDQLGCQGGY